MGLELTKVMEISTGHRLPLHNGGCSNFHGHNYGVKVRLLFYPDSHKKIQQVGFVIDFKEIKQIINLYDHKFLMHSEDEYLADMKDMPGLVIVDYSPSVENIVKDYTNQIAKVIQDKLKQGNLVDDSGNYPNFKINLSISETKTAICSKQTLFEYVPRQGLWLEKTY